MNDDLFALLGDSTYRILHSGGECGDRITVAVRGESIAGEGEGEYAVYGGGGRRRATGSNVGGFADNGADEGAGEGGGTDKEPVFFCLDTPSAAGKVELVVLDGSDIGEGWDPGPVDVCRGKLVPPVLAGLKTGVRAL